MISNTEVFRACQDLVGNQILKLSWISYRSVLLGYSLRLS